MAKKLAKNTRKNKYKFIELENKILNKKYKRTYHRLTKHALYKAWGNIKQKCYNKKHINYYGEKIKICKEWKDDFIIFYDWAIKYWKKGLCLSRKNEGGDYSPENCYFKSRKEVATKNIKKGALLLIGKSRSIESIEKTKKTNLQRYGVEYPAQSKDIQEKMKKTNLKKYGVENSTQFEEIKRKIVNTNLKRYGGVSPASCKKVIEKIKQTNLQKYGVENVGQHPNIKKKIKQTKIQNGTIVIKDGKTLKELAKELDRSYSGFVQLVSKHGIDKALLMNKRESYLQVIIRCLLEKNEIEFGEEERVENRKGDFFLPQYNLMIEGDGIYYHSDKFIEDKKYHKEKQELYRRHGYSSIFFREDELENKLEVVESIILNKIGRTKNKIFARKCKIVSLSNDERKEFFEKNHLMGKGSGKCFGLKFQGEIVCAAQFVVRKNYTDISRFCNKLNTTVVGGFSRLIRKIEEFTKTPKISTFIDLRYGNGKYLEGLGFLKESEHLSFKWIKDHISIHRMKFPGNSGYGNGWNKIWDCGQAKYIKCVKNNNG